MENTTLRNKQKLEAINRMKKLKLMTKVITDFKNHDIVYYSERRNELFNAILYWVSNKETYVKEIAAFEKKYNALVYHAQLTHTIWGDMLALLYVSSDESHWDYDNRGLEIGSQLVYVINGDFREFGTIGIKSSMGGITRVA